MFNILSQQKKKKTCSDISSYSSRMGIKKTNNQGRQRCGDKESHIHCLREYKCSHYGYQSEYFSKKK